MDKEQYLIIHSRHINNYIYNFVAQKTKTLDVGCNMGNLGEKLIKEKNCKVWGIDYCEKAIEIAKKKLTKAIVFDLETYQIPFSKEKFDLIIFADVLEHTRYPEIILRKYLSILNEGGGG
jgi:2-polyprenyl-3-methyl-5-hydroxy-6-metoxy-1,4-benzoquinol methylase